MRLKHIVVLSVLSLGACKASQINPKARPFESGGKFPTLLREAHAGYPQCIERKATELDLSRGVDRIAAAIIADHCKAELIQATKKQLKVGIYFSQNINHSNCDITISCFNEEMNLIENVYLSELTQDISQSLSRVRKNAPSQ